MGSFLGHVVPGTFFTCFGLWWAYNMFFRYFYAKRFRPSSYRNVTRFPCCCASGFPLESVLKIVLVNLGIAGEFFTGFVNGKFVHWGNAQHMTMFFFFGLNGLIDLLQHRKWDLPPKLDYVTAAIAFSIEGFLFYNHLHGRSHMDIMVHMFLVNVIVGCVFATVAEMHQPKNFLVALTRVFFVLLQGTWFFQIGFILHSPIGESWDQDNHEQMMVVTLIFAWHVAALLATLMGLGIIIYFRVRNLKGQVEANYHMVDTNDIPNAKDKHGNGYLHAGDGSMIQMLDSESEDV